MVINTTPASKSPQAIRARWILPGDSPPIRDGLLVMNQGRITFVGPAPAGDSAGTWQEVAILPKFVNAHTHLEFSSLQEPLGTPGMPFCDWIRLVIAWRRDRDQDESARDAARRRAILQGLHEVTASGTCAGGDIATFLSAKEVLDDSVIRGIAFWELIGLAPDRIDPLAMQMRQLFAGPAHQRAAFSWGLSPHAPYSVHPDLLDQAVRLSAQRRAPVAMHLAETEEERQLLRDGTGPFSDLLRELGVWNPSALRRSSRPLDYLQVLGRAHHALVIHGNYLDLDEQQWLAQHRDRMTLVYCPRTHDYFRHPRYPLQSLLQQGIRIALGTDSRASNPGLNMLEEVRWVAAQHPEVAPDECLRMATIHGASALGLDHELGSLTVGKQAQFLAIPLATGSEDDPYGWLETPSQ